MVNLSRDGVAKRTIDFLVHRAQRIENSLRSLRTRTSPMLPYGKIPTAFSFLGFRCIGQMDFTTEETEKARDGRRRNDFDAPRSNRTVNAR